MKKRIDWRNGIPELTMHKATFKIGDNYSFLFDDDVITDNEAIDEYIYQLIKRGKIDRAKHLARRRCEKAG